MQRHIAFRLLISFFIVALVIPTVYAAPRGTVSQILSIAGEVEDARSVRDEVRNLKTRIASFNKRLKNAAKVKKLKVRRALEREVKRELTLLRRELKVLERELRLEARTRALKARSAKTPRASVPPQTPGAARIDELLKNGAGESGKVPPGLEKNREDRSATTTPSIIPTPTTAPSATVAPTLLPSFSPTPFPTTAPVAPSTTPQSTATTTPALSPTPPPTPTPTPTPTPAPAPVAPSAQPIGFWKFDGSGANEIAGSPNAVSVGSATYSASGGKWGGYGYIPGSADSFKIPYASMFDLPNTFTIEFWFRQRADRSFLQDLVYKGNGMNNYNFRVFRQLWNQYNFGPIITGYTAVGTGYWSQTSNSNQLAHNAWHHVVYTKDTNGSAYYLDGALTHALDTTQYKEYAGAARTPAVDIIIGDSAVDTDIDNLRIYNYGFTKENAQYNFQESIPASSVATPTPTPTPLPTPTPTPQPTATTTPAYGSSLDLTGVTDLLSIIWGPGSNGIIIGGGLNFSTQVGVGWSQQYGGKYVTSYSIQGSSSNYIATSTPVIASVSVRNATGWVIEVWDLESMSVAASNVHSPGSATSFTAQPNRRYGGFGWYADNAQKNIEIFATLP